MRMLRRTASLIGLTVMVGVMTATPAVALHRADVVGRVVGEAPFEFGAGCSFVRQHFVGTIDTPAPGDASIDVDVCITLGAAEDPALAEGTFTLVTPSATLSGTADGTVARSLPKQPFVFTLLVGANTEQRIGVGSTLYFRGVWRSDILFGGPIKGRIGTSPP